MCFLRVRAHRYAVSQRLLDLLCAAFFATAPPALRSLPRTSAAVTELLFRIIYTAAACKRFRDAYAQMQAPTKPGKLVHHHASILIEEALPSTLRRAANATRQRVAREDFMRNPHAEKKAVPSTRALCACGRANGSV